MARRGGRKAKKTGAGWRVNGTRVYHVKGKTRSRRKTYKTKRAAKKRVHR